MAVREATGTDIVSLLLYCAPQKILDELELTQENANEEAEFFDNLKSGVYGKQGEDGFVYVFALALYYSAKKLPLKVRAHYNIIESIHIPFFVLRKLVEHIEVEQYTKVSDLNNEVRKEKDSKRLKRVSEKRNWSRYRKAEMEIKKIFSTGKYGNSRNACAKNEYQNLNISLSKARDYLKGTPDPIPK